MNDTKARPAVSGLWLFAFALFTLFLLGLRTINGPDFWLHLASGHHVATTGIATQDPFSFGLAAETAWRQVTWLYDWALYRMWQAGGAPLTILLHALLAPLAFIMLTGAIADKTTRSQQAGAILLSAWLLSPALHAGPRLPALVLAALFIRTLASARLTSSGLVALIVAQVIWANAHLSFVTGPLLALLSALESMLKNRRESASPLASDAAKRLMLTIALVAATLVNPFGFRIWTEFIATATTPLNLILLDWTSPFYTDFIPVDQSWVSIAALGLIGAAFILRRERLPLMLTGGAILSAFMIIRTGYLIDFAAILCMPFLALSINTLAGMTSARAPWLSTTSAAAVGVACLLAIGVTITNRQYIATGSSASFGWHENTRMYPGALLDRLDGTLPAPLVNLTQDGGYLLWRNPGKRVYVDTRGDLYGREFYAALFRSLTGQKDSNGLETPLPEKTSAVLLNATWSGSRSALARFLADPAWGVAYFDGTSILLLLRDEANKPLLDDATLASDGLALIQEEYKTYQRALAHPFFRPAVPARLIGAAATYQIMGRFEESLALYELITEGAPRMASAWLNRGIAETAVGKTGAAMNTLEQATRMLPDNPLGWLWLGRAYSSAGRSADAEAATARGRVLNPEMAERFIAGQK